MGPLTVDVQAFDISIVENHINSNTEFKYLIPVNGIIAIKMSVSAQWNLFGSMECLSENESLDINT